MKEILNKLKMRLPAIALLVATFAFWSNYDPFQPDGPALLESAKLADADYVEGDCSETDSVFTLTRPTGGIVPMVGFKLTDVSNYERLRLGGRMRADSVASEGYDFNGARLSLIQRDAAGRVVGRFDEGVQSSGKFGWTKYQGDYSIYRRVEQVDVLLTQQGESGSVQFDSIEVSPVRLKDHTHWIKIPFAIAWLVMGIVYFQRCRLHTRKLRHLILLNVLLILVGVLLPTKVVQYGIHDLKQLISYIQVDASPENVSFVTAGLGFKLPADFEDNVGRTFGHFILFGSLCFLVLLSGALEGQPRSYYFKVAFDLLLFGAVTESLQYLTPDRSVDIGDMLYNAYGMLSAMALFIVLRNLRRNPARWIIGKTN